jgi:nitrogen fixation protein NifU and related proteins
MFNQDYEGRHMVTFTEDEKSEEEIKKEMIDLLMEKITGGLSEKVVDYGNHPRNYGSLDKPDGYAKIKGPCGDTMEMFLKIQNDRIVDIAYTTDGCMTSHAAGTAATVMAKGNSVRECLKITQSGILEHLGGMPEESQHCALLAANTFHKALRDFAIGRKK